MKSRSGEFWDLTFLIDTGARSPRTTHVQAWAGVESVFEDDGREERVWLPRRKLGEPHAVVTSVEDARALAAKDGEASGLTHWTEE